jgi:hypothetical protein
MVARTSTNKSKSTKQEEDRDASKSASGIAPDKDQGVGIRRRVFQRYADRNGRLGVFHRTAAGKVVPLVSQLSANQRSPGEHQRLLREHRAAAK